MISHMRVCNAHFLLSVSPLQVIMENGRSRGRGFVQYTTPDEARNAVEMLNGKILGGRPLHVAINNEQHKTSFAWTQRVQQHRESQLS